MDATKLKIYSLDSLGNGGTDKPEEALCSVHYTRVLFGFFFQSLNSSGKSIGIAGGNQERKVLQHSKGFQSWGVNRAPRTFEETVNLISWVKRRAPRSSRATRIRVVRKGQTSRARLNNTNRRYSFRCVDILLTQFTYNALNARAGKWGKTTALRPSWR